MKRVVHILYSGVGGQGGVVFPLAAASSSHAESFAIFYGVEPMAEANVRRCEELALPWRAWVKQPGMDMDQQRAMAAWIVSLRADAVIAHNLAVLPACRIARKQLPDLRILAVEHHCNALKSARRWLLSLVAPWASDCTVYLTEAYRDEVKRKLRWLHRTSRTAVIPNALDLSAYPVASPDPAQPFTAGMQGRMVDGKDFATLIRAAAALKDRGELDLHLELAGDGPDRPALEALAASLNVSDRVRFLGLLDHADLVRAMSRWHVYAHSSDGETMSIAIMEARACGLPVIASASPGVTPYVSHGVDGLLAAPRDPDAFAAAFRTLEASREQCAVMSRASLAIAARDYSSERAWRSYSAHLFPEPPPLSRKQPAAVTSISMP